jgi:hypothetical protein
MTGAVLIFLVIFLPGGILSLPERVGFFRKGASASSPENLPAEAEKGEDVS